ncbi:MAG: RluA family pseudouridine synthase, partial [Holosporales bacterium]|nr:RluA family pseudouridine synthase [Holosporales bacterium]
MQTVHVPANLNGARLDVALAELLQCSRSHAQKLISEGRITCNDVVVTQSKHKVCENGVIAVRECSPTTQREPLQIDLDIVYEDDSLLVINKPAGLVVHPSAGHYEDTLVNALLAHCPQLSDMGDHPGIVHRLDKDTSGLILVAKTNAAHAALAAQFCPIVGDDGLPQKRAMRTYAALVHGMPP